MTHPCIVAAVARERHRALMAEAQAVILVKQAKAHRRSSAAGRCNGLFRRLSDRRLRDAVVLNFDSAASGESIPWTPSGPGDGSKPIPTAAAGISTLL
jgi:hypothetical protein